LKKSEADSDKPNDLSILAASITIIANELKQIAQTVDHLITAVANQNKAISDLYTVQEFLLKQMKNELETESKLPDLNKAKKEKPN
jgi:hypothetical protein